MPPDRHTSAFAALADPEEKAAERIQRRLAAILAADVVGYSRLMAQDEGGTLGALKARRRDVIDPLVSLNHGRIVKVMGDGVLVEFASAVNAVSCAIELQNAMSAANSGLPEERHIALVPQGQDRIPIALDTWSVCPRRALLSPDDLHCPRPRAVMSS